MYMYIYICIYVGQRYRVLNIILSTRVSPRPRPREHPSRARLPVRVRFSSLSTDFSVPSRPTSSDPWIHFFFFCCFLRAHEPLLRHPCSVAALTCDNGGGSIFFLLQNGSRFISFGQNHCSDWKFLIRYILKIKLACDIRYLWFSTFY
jgi:hypothetical protein